MGKRVLSGWQGLGAWRGVGRGRQGGWTERRWVQRGRWHLICCLQENPRLIRTSTATSHPKITSTTSTTVVVQTSAAIPAITSVGFATGTGRDVVVTVASSSLMTLSSHE